MYLNQRGHSAFINHSHMCSVVEEAVNVALMDLGARQQHKTWWLNAWRIAHEMVREFLFLDLD